MTAEKIHELMHQESYTARKLMTKRQFKNAAMTFLVIGVTVPTHMPIAPGVLCHAARINFETKMKKMLPAEVHLAVGSLII